MESKAIEEGLKLSGRLAALGPGHTLSILVPSQLSSTGSAGITF